MDWTVFHADAVTLFCVESIGSWEAVCCLERERERKRILPSELE